jgi:hypothetical protein
MQKMAFKYHDEAIIPFNNKQCDTTLENGSKCSQNHCVHYEDVCELADEPKTFNNRYCDICRLGLFHSLRRKTEEMKGEKLQKSKETGKDYFIATGYNSSAGWQYEHVNTGDQFWDNTRPDTEEIIENCGKKWLNRKEQQKKHPTHQTKLMQFFTK